MSLDWNDPRCAEPWVFKDIKRDRGPLHSAEERLETLMHVARSLADQIDGLLWDYYPTPQGYPRHPNHEALERAQIHADDVHVLLEHLLRRFRGEKDDGDGGWEPAPSTREETEL
jgi:hypothetical protein